MLIKISEIHVSEIQKQRLNIDFDLFIALAESIKKEGQLNPITVTKYKQKRATENYNLIDGLQRYLILRCQGVEMIDINIKE